MLVNKYRMYLLNKRYQRILFSFDMRNVKDWSLLLAEEECVGGGEQCTKRDYTFKLSSEREVV